MPQPNPEAQSVLEIPPPRLAGLLRRFASLAYEAILLVPVLFIAAYLFLAFARDARTPAMHVLFQLWLLAVMASYLAYCWRRGQTLAMKTWHIRLARVDGAALSAKQAAARFFLALAGLFLFGAAFWWAFFDRDRQFLHDRIARTRLWDASVVPAGKS